MIWATVLQKQTGKASRRRGKHGFVQLPNLGDHIQILNESLRLDLMRVLYVQHTPLPSDNPNDLGEWDWPFSAKIAEGALRNQVEPAVQIICELTAKVS